MKTLSLHLPTHLFLFCRFVHRGHKSAPSISDFHLLLFFIILWLRFCSVRENLFVLLSSRWRLVRRGRELRRRQHRHHQWHQRTMLQLLVPSWSSPSSRPASSTRTSACSTRKNATSSATRATASHYELASTATSS